MPRRPPLSGDKQLGLGTRAVHPPRPTPQDGTPVAPVLDPASTYSFDDTASFAKASEEKVGAGYVYTRWANPTIDAFEAAVADLEGAEEAEAFASGMAAISTTFLSACSSGDRIVAARQLYGGTFAILTQTLPRYGIEATLVDVADHAGIEAALDGASLLYCETIGNPRIEVANLPVLGKLAAAAGVPFVVDNTFASPVLCRPIEHGADVVIHSATKFLGGHHDLIGGVVCGSPPFLDKMRELARELGAVLSPFNAWLALRGIATIQLRVERSSAGAAKIARVLDEHAGIDGVFYPTLAGGSGADLAARLLGGHGGGTLAFDVAGGRERTARFQEALRVIMRAASLGGTHSLIVHAASVTHTQLTDAELDEAGISEGFCRLSVGLEDHDDLIADLLQALEASA
ncbi:MAG TPA: aminotransferase class I/II-fold pyridoxal phosphate-dependent enzyme [Actinomycetota bacterium]|nr:aminotransferase class I/II-fold pyridoxal phosphate-dependent enzyme [Actinomycetota bacterium]